MTEQWQRVAFGGNGEPCPDKLGCLLALPAVDRPTTVSIKQVPFASIRGFKSCMPNQPAPGLTSDSISFEAYRIEALTSGVSTDCPAFGSDRLSPGTAERYVPWRRSDSRPYPFESAHHLGYTFVPLGGSDTSGGQHVRCVLIVDPSEASGTLPMMDLSEAAEMCITLFYFRERR